MVRADVPVQWERKSEDWMVQQFASSGVKMQYPTHDETVSSSVALYRGDCTCAARAGCDHGADAKAHELNVISAVPAN